MSGGVTFETVSEGKGELGISNRVLIARRDGGWTHIPQMLDALRERGGCCAWQGRTACGGHPSHAAVGGIRLAFVVYREVHVEGGESFALLCDRHADNLYADMPRQLRRSQDREFRKALKMLGEEEREETNLVAIVPLAVFEG